MRSSLPLVIALVVACNKGDDTGDTDAIDPCISVGDRSFLTIQEAVDYAPEGSTVTLCDADFEESAVIDKDLTLSGAGDTDTRWTGATGEAVITVTGDANVIVESIGFDSTYAGILANGDGSLEVRACTFYSANTYAIDAGNTDVVVHAVSILNPQFGGVRVQGGTLSLDASAISGAVGFGVKVEDGAVAQIFDNDIAGISFSGDGSDVTDGWGVWISDAEAHLSMNRFASNIIGDVEADGELSILTMDGDVSEGSYSGVWLDGPGADIKNVTFNNYLQYGIVHQSNAEVLLENVAITTTREASNPQTALDGFSGSFGIIVFGGDLTLTNVTVSGNNGGGIYQNIANNASVDLETHGVTVDDNARFGIVSYGGTMHLNDATVTRTHGDDATCLDPVYNQVYCGFAVANFGSSVEWTGGLLQDSDANYGLTLVQGSGVVSGVTFGNNAGSAAFAQEAGFVCDQCTFAAGRSSSVAAQSGASVVITNSEFLDAAYDYSFEYTDYYTGDLWRYVSYYQAMDISVSGSSLTVTGTRFHDGQNAIYGSDAQIAIVESSFDNLHGDALTLFGSGSESTLDVIDTSFDGVAGDVLNCYSSTANLEGVEITDVSRQMSKYEYYVNDVFNSSVESEYSTRALYSSGCALNVEDMTIENTEDYAADLYDGSVSIDGLTIKGAWQSAPTSIATLQLTFNNTPPDALLDHVNITGTNGSGIQLTSSLGGGVVQMSGLSLGGDDGEGHAGILGGPGLRLSGVEGAIVSGFMMDGTAGEGIRIERGTAQIAGLSGVYTGVITDAQVDGISLSDATVQLDLLTVAGAAGDGVHVQGGEVTIGASVAGEGDGYGMQCVSGSSAPVVNNCDAGTWDGTLGETLGCGCTGGDTDDTGN